MSIWTWAIILWVTYEVLGYIPHWISSHSGSGPALMWGNLRFVWVIFLGVGIYSVGWRLLLYVAGLWVVWTVLRWTFIGSHAGAKQ